MLSLIRPSEVEPIVLWSTCESTKSTSWDGKSLTGRTAVIFHQPFPPSPTQTPTLGANQKNTKQAISQLILTYPKQQISENQKKSIQNQGPDPLPTSIKRLTWTPARASTRPRHTKMVSMDGCMKRPPAGRAKTIPTWLGAWFAR